MKTKSVDSFLTGVDEFKTESALPLWRKDDHAL